MLLVGARAVQCWFGEQARATSDWDVWFVGESFERWVSANSAQVLSRTPLPAGRMRAVAQLQGERIQASVAPAGGSEDAFLAASTESRLAIPALAGARVASAPALALIKRSHLYDPEHWHRHVDDYHFLKSRCDLAAAPPAILAAGALRRREWAEQHPQDTGSGSMKIPNAVFFANTRAARIRAYEHDGLHRATCYGERPLYALLKDDPELAFVEARHFEAMTHLDKIRLVREETYAIALERVVIPSMEIGVAWDARQAFLHALRRICTNLTKGWFRDFAIEHYPEVSRFDTDYVARFREALARNRLSRLPDLPDAGAWRARLREHLAEISRIDAQAFLA